MNEYLIALVIFVAALSVSIVDSQTPYNDVTYSRHLDAESLARNGIVHHLAAKQWFDGNPGHTGIIPKGAGNLDDYVRPGTRLSNLWESAITPNGDVITYSIGRFVTEAGDEGPEQVLVSNQIHSHIPNGRIAKRISHILQSNLSGIVTSIGVEGFDVPLSSENYGLNVGVIVIVN